MATRKNLVQIVLKRKACHYSWTTELAPHPSVSVPTSSPHHPGLALTSSPHLPGLALLSSPHLLGAASSTRHLNSVPQLRLRSPSPYCSTSDGRLVLLSPVVQCAANKLHGTHRGLRKAPLNQRPRRVLPEHEMGF